MTYRTLKHIPDSVSSLDERGSLLAYVSLLIVFLNPFPILPFVTQPFLAYGVLFFWFLRDTQNLSSVFLFLSTLIVDIEQGLFWGETFLVLMVFIHVIKQNKQLVRQHSFFLQWIVFGFFVLIYSFCVWIVGVIFKCGRPFEQWIIGVAWAFFTYPLIFFLFETLLKRKSE